MSHECSRAVQATASRGHKRLLVSTEYVSWLGSLGLHTPDAFLRLRGEVISGHPRRHVMRLVLGRDEFFLKREHQVNRSDRLKNAWAGFGFVSSSIREAKTLVQLNQLGFSCPEWIAAGETGDGRAFLLVRSVSGRKSLREALETDQLSSELDIRIHVRQLAGAVARLHATGICYPDLVAKHILVSPEGKDPIFLDWQRGRQRRRVTTANRARDLAALHASIRAEVLRPFQRLRFLVEYGRVSGLDRSELRSLYSLILRRAQRLERKSSFREQRLPGARTSQSLFWEDADRLCVTELGRRLTRNEELFEWAYSSDGALEPTSTRIVQLKLGSAARLIRRRTKLTGWQRLQRMLRGDVFLSPECQEAAELLRSERLGRAPRLLAFGQWERSRNVFDSFLLYLADEFDASDLRGSQLCHA